MERFLNDLKLVINKYQNSSSNEEKLLCYKDYTALRELLLTYLDSDIPYIDILNKEDLDQTFNKEKAFITGEIDNNKELLSYLYTKILDYIPSFDIEETIENQVNNEIFKTFFNSFDNMNELYQKLLDSDGIQVNEDYTIPTTLSFDSINKSYILLPPNRYLQSLPHEMGHIYQNKLIKKDNYLIEEFLSILMELLFIDYYSNIDINTSNLLKDGFKSNLFFLLLNTSAQLELIKRFPDSFINMDLNPDYRVEFNSINLFPCNISKQELYLQYYGIGFILAINYYYKYKENNDFNTIKEFIINNEDNNLNTLLSNVDLSLIYRFMNEYFSNDKKASK